MGASHTEGEQSGGAPYAGQQPPYAGQQPPYAGQQHPYAGQPQYGSQPQPLAPAALGGRPQASFTDDGVRLSGWWWRVLAAWLDGILVSLLVAIPALPIYRRMIGSIAVYFNEVLRAAQAGKAAPQPDMTTFLSSTDQAALLAIQIGVALVFHIGFLRWKSATPGLMICRLRVVPLDQGRSTTRLTWNSVVIRALIWVLPGISGILLLFRLIDGLFPLWQPKRQALHDIAARTQVIRPG